MARLLIAVALALLAAFPLGWIIAMMLTPLLWSLEPILHVELAGHSGPSDWVFYVVMLIVAFPLFFLFRRVLRPTVSTSTQ